MLSIKQVADYLAQTLGMNATQDTLQKNKILLAGNNFYICDDDIKHYIYTKTGFNFRTENTLSKYFFMAAYYLTNYTVVNNQDRYHGLLLNNTNILVWTRNEG